VAKSTWLGRRGFLSAVGAVTGWAVTERIAHASLVRGLTLTELLASSTHAVVGTALEAHSAWMELGGRRLIVTDTRVRIEETLAREAPAEGELIVRVLGGIIGHLGERVDGQAELVLGEPSTLFLTPQSPGLTFVTGAAQGHYPLVADERASLRLRASPHLPTMLKRKGSAVTTLTGATLAEARDLMRAAQR